jgi:hypothetical protein
MNHFCSLCANNGVPKRMWMDGLGHGNSEMIRHHDHLHDAKQRVG